MSRETAGGGGTGGSLFPALLDAAARLAAQGHYRQFRKGSDDRATCEETDYPLPVTCVPYITHPMAVMCILARLGASDRVLAAALLHDYLEDVPDPDGRGTIRRAVGDEVLSLVEEVTENKRRQLDDSESWQARKQEQVDRIAHMPEEAVLLKAADLLHNLDTLVADLAVAGDRDAVWGRLNAGPEQQLWYFDSVLAAARMRLQGHPLITELEGALRRLRRLVTP